MGSPKPLLDLGGETFLDRLIRLFRETCESVTVVLGHELDRITQCLKRAGDAQFVWNPDYKQGQLTSLQAGLRHIPEEVSAVLFTPVDYPAIQPSTIASIAARWQEMHGKPLLVVPRWGGRRGHPVLASSFLIPEFLDLPLTSLARDVIHKHVDRTVYVDVADPGIVKDIDDPRDYAELLSSATKLE